MLFVKKKRKLEKESNDFVEISNVVSWYQEEIVSTQPSVCLLETSST